MILAEVHTIGTLRPENRTAALFLPETRVERVPSLPLVLELLHTPCEAWNNHSTGARRDVRSAWTSIEDSFSQRLPAKRLQQCGWLLLFALAVTLCAKFAFYCIFTRFVPYDDEGFILISLKSFLAGKPLYR